MVYNHFIYPSPLIIYIDCRSECISKHQNRDVWPENVYDFGAETSDFDRICKLTRVKETFLGMHF